MKLDLNYEELHILERALLAEVVKESKSLEVLERYWNDDVCEYQRNQISLMNGLLGRLNVIYMQSFREEGQDD